MLSSYQQNQIQIDEKQQLRNKIKSLEQEIIQRTRNFMHHHKSNKKKLIENCIEIAVQTDNQILNNAASQNVSGRGGKNGPQGDDNQLCTSHSSKNVCNSHQNSPSNFTAIIPSSPQTLEPLSQSLDLQNLQSSFSILQHDLKISKTRCQFITKALVQSQETNYELRIKLQETEKKLREIGNGTKEECSKQYEGIIQALKIKVEQMEIMKKEYLRAYSKIKQQKQQLELSLLSQSLPESAPASSFLNSIPQLSEEEMEQTFRRTSASTTIGGVKQLIERCLLESNRSSSQKWIKTALLKLQQLQLQQIEDKNRQQQLKQYEQQLKQQQQLLLRQQQELSQKHKQESQQQQLLFHSQRQQLQQLSHQNRQQSRQWRQKQAQKCQQIISLHQKQRCNYASSIQSLHQHYKQLLLAANKSYTKEKEILQNNFNLLMNKIIKSIEKEKEMSNGTSLPEIVMLKKPSKIHLDSNHGAKQTHKLAENTNQRNIKYAKENKIEDSRQGENDEKGWPYQQEKEGKKKIESNETIGNWKAQKRIEIISPRIEKEFKQFMQNLIHKFNKNTYPIPLETETDSFIPKISQIIFQTLCNLPTGDHGTIMFPPSTTSQLLTSLQCLYNFSLSYDTIQLGTQNSHNQQLHNICKIIEQIIEHHSYELDGEFVIEVIRQRCLQGQVNNVSEYLKKIIDVLQQKEKVKDN